MRVVLVVPPAVDEADDGSLAPAGMDALRLFPPYGVYLLASVVRAAGHDVCVVDLVARGSLDLRADDLADADLIGVSASSLVWPAARLVLDRIRELCPDAFVVAGGVHPTLFDEWVLRTTPVDLVVRGDGETPMTALVTALAHGRSLDSVPSASRLAPDGRIVRTADAAPVGQADLDRWVPAFDLVPDRAYWGLSLETSRGCAYDCSFCSTPHRRRWRGGTADIVVDRLESVLAHRHRTLAGPVYLVDDEFTMRPGRAAEIGRTLTDRGVEVGLLYDARAPDLLRPGVLDALAPHTRSLLVGAECGYDEGLARIGKGTTCATIDAAAAALARHGLAGRADFSFVLGLPWEGLAEVQRSVAFAFDLAERYGVHLVLNWYAQIPGSHLFADVLATGAVTVADYDRVGVLRDPRIFASGVRLTPGELDAVVDDVAQRTRALPAGVPRPTFAPPVAHASAASVSIRTG